MQIQYYFYFLVRFTILLNHIRLVQPSLATCRLRWCWYIAVTLSLSSGTFASAFQRDSVLMTTFPTPTTCWNAAFIQLFWFRSSQISYKVAGCDDYNYLLNHPHRLSHSGLCCGIVFVRIPTWVTIINKFALFAV